MGCCGSTLESEPLISPDEVLDPMETKFVKGVGVIPTRDVAIPADIMDPWGYRVSRRYMGGSGRG